MVQAGFELVIFRSQVHCLIRYSKLLVMNIGQKNLSCLCSMRKIVWQMKKIVLREIRIFEKYKFQLYLAHLFYNLTSKFLYCCSYWVYGYSQFDLHIRNINVGHFAILALKCLFSRGCGGLVYVTHTHQTLRIFQN